MMFVGLTSPHKVVRIQLSYHGIDLLFPFLVELELAPEALTFQDCSYLGQGDQGHHNPYNCSSVLARNDNIL